jgi:citrate lyase beta subunit
VPKIGSDSTLDVATWNIEWFGDSINGPNNEVTQLKNVTEVITSMDMDIMALCEVSNPGYWQKLQNNLTEYGAVITTYTQTQKTALLYRKSMFKLLYSKSILLAYDYEFASGRFPLEVALETQRVMDLCYTNKSAIHPAQVDAIQRAFLPTSHELAYAEKVVAAMKAADGAAIAVDGKLVDRPIELAALRVIELAKLGLRDKDSKLAQVA